MQEAYGGTFMLKLFMVFFVIYVAFIGVALNFAKIYRIKNNVINILEQYQYSGGNNALVYSKLKDYLESVPYKTKFGSELKFSDVCQKGSRNGEGSFSDLGICVIPLGEEGSGKQYYLVKVFHVINFPILSVLDLPITASGETVVINVD